MQLTEIVGDGERRGGSFLLSMSSLTGCCTPTGLTSGGDVCSQLKMLEIERGDSFLLPWSGLIDCCTQTVCTAGADLFWKLMMMIKKANKYLNHMSIKIAN